MAKVLIDGVSKKFDDKTILKDVTLDIKDKEFCVLVGASGCGKSTLLRIVAGLEKENAGKIFIGENCVNDISPKDRDIAFVFQSYALYPHLNVFDNIAFPLKIKGYDKKEIEKRVMEASKTLGLDELLKRKPKELSGGQRQRVALGRAIVREPKVFLMDEPLSNLDAKLRISMRSEIKKLHQKLQTTFIYVTHDQTEALTMGDKIVVLNDGIIQQQGTSSEIYKTPKNIFVATFMGNLPMNIIKTDDKYIGFRPEDVNVGNTGYTFKPNVNFTEISGADKIIYFDYQGAKCCAKLHSDTEINPDTTLCVNEDKLHYFDINTKERI